MGIHNNGRPSASDKFKTVFSYLNEYLFPIKDRLIEFKQDEYKKRKIYLSSQGKTRLQEMRLESAYKGLEKFRK